MKTVWQTLSQVAEKRTLAGRFNQFITCNFCMAGLATTFFPELLEWIGVDFSQGGVLVLQVGFFYFSSLTLLGFLLSRLDIELQTMATFLHRGFDIIFFPIVYALGQYQLLFVLYAMVMGPLTAFIAYLLWQKERTYAQYWKSLATRLNAPTAWSRALLYQGWVVAVVGTLAIFMPELFMEYAGLGHVFQPYQVGFFRFLGLIILFLGITYGFNGYHAIAGFGEMVLAQQAYFLAGFPALLLVTDMPMALFSVNFFFIGICFAVNLIMFKRRAT